MEVYQKYLTGIPTLDSFVWDRFLIGCLQKKAKFPETKIFLANTNSVKSRNQIDRKVSTD
ncbi:hypothetical protein LEP1GSC071_2305 [Leptospira santarosai str. JET]|nr:hypothetical protein LEP1GSC071_2305 [Leptospira santarosai str. JET]